MSKLLRDIYGITGIIAVAFMFLVWLDALLITKAIFGDSTRSFQETSVGSAWYFNVQRYIESQKRFATKYTNGLLVDKSDLPISDPITVYFKKIEGGYTPKIGKPTIDSSSLVLIIYRNDIEVPEEYVFKCGPGGSGADRSTEESLLNRRSYVKLSPECARKPSNKATISELIEWANSMRASFYYGLVPVAYIDYVALPKQGEASSSFEWWYSSWILPLFVETALKLNKNVCEQQEKCELLIQNAKLFYEFPDGIPENVATAIGRARMNIGEFGIWVQLNLPSKGEMLHLFLSARKREDLIVDLPYHQNIDLSEYMSNYWILNNDLKLSLASDLDRSSFKMMTFMNGLTHVNIEIGRTRLSLLTAISIVSFLALIDTLIYLRRKAFR